jgi:nitronate monooxygenase
MALVPLVVDRVKVPVIAAGGIADGRGIAAALTLGATAAQIGTAYLFCPEASISPLHRAALADAQNRTTVHTNVFTGRPARGFVNRIIREIGPMAADAPDFPLPGSASAPLRQAGDARGVEDFSALWAGQAAALGRAMPAGDLTRLLAAEAESRLAAARQGL